MNEEELKKEIERLKKENHTKYYDDSYGYDIEVFNDKEIKLLEIELKGFQEGRTQMLNDVKELVDNWASNSVLTFDDDSIAQTELKEDICRYVKKLKELLSSLDNLGVKE